MDLKSYIMLEESFWTIGFRKIGHKKSQKVWVYIDGYTANRPLETIKDLNRLVKFQSREDAERRILEIKIMAKEVKGVSSDIIERACFTSLQITKKDVKSNTKG